MDSEKRFFIAVKGLIFHEDRFLIIKRSDIARDEKGSWELPGGRLEFGETTETALKREVEEEVGLDISIIKPLYSWTLIREGKTQTIGLTFLCVSNEKEIILSPEHDKYRWIREDEIINFNLSPIITEDLKKLDWDNIKTEAKKTTEQLSS